jgi:hypothetical protein
MKYITEFGLFNENGLIIDTELVDFCKSFVAFSMFDITGIFEIEKNIILKTSFQKEEITITFYKSGYIIFFEGDLLISIILLAEFDRFLNKDKVFFISPNSQFQNSPNLEFPRGIKLKEIAIFLDKIFNNRDYTNTLAGNPPVY